MNKNILITAVVTATIAGGLGFMVGRKDNPKIGIGQRRMNGQMQNNQKPMMGRGVVSGEVTEKDDKTLTIKTEDGGSSTVILSESTSYRILSEASMDKITIGSKVAIFGTPSTDGSTVATSIEINPLLRGQVIKR